MIAPYIFHKYNERQIRQRISDGFFSATDMCKCVNRLFADFYRNKFTKEYLSILSITLHRPKSELVEITQGGATKEQGTWIHPQVATMLGIWMSPGFAVKVGIWIEEWKESDLKNANIYNDSICQLECSKNDLLEKTIQEKLCDELKAEKEVETLAGFIDILTDTKIIEIKEFSEWKSALGQVLSYGTYYPDREKVIILFGKIQIESIEIIQNIYSQFQIELQIYTE